MENLNKLVPHGPQQTYSLARYLAGYATGDELITFGTVMARAQLEMEQNPSLAGRRRRSVVPNPVLRLFGKDELTRDRLSFQAMIEEDINYQEALQRKKDMILTSPRESVETPSHFQVFDPTDESVSFTEARRPPTSHPFYPDKDSRYIRGEFAFLNINEYDGNIETSGAYNNTYINLAWKDIPKDDASGYEKKLVLGIWSYDNHTYNTDQEWILKMEEINGNYESYVGMKKLDNRDFYYRIRVPINTAHPLTHFEIRRMERQETQGRRTLTSQ